MKRNLTISFVTALSIFLTVNVWAQDTIPAPQPVNPSSQGTAQPMPAESTAAPASQPVQAAPAPVQPASTTPAPAQAPVQPAATTPAPAPVQPAATTPAPAPAPVQPAATTPAPAPAPVASSSYSDSDDPAFHFGFKFAPTMAWLKPDSKGLEREGSKLGFSYGIVTEFSIQKNYTFATGLQITYRGGKLSYIYNNHSENPTFEYDLNLKFIEIPLTLKMKTNEFGKLRYFGQFGLSPGFKLSAKVDQSLTSVGTTTGWTEDKEYDEDFSDYVNSFNLSMVIAGGVEYKLSGTTVFFSSLEFNNGFVDIFGTVEQPIIVGNPDTAPPRVVKWTGFSNYFALNLGILF